VSNYPSVIVEDLLGCAGQSWACSILRSLRWKDWD